MSLSDDLRDAADEEWTAATEHRFVRELGAGAIGDDVFRRYLVQDYAFVDALTSLIGHAAGQADRVEARARLAGFLRRVATDEDDYFRRSFDALSVPRHRRKSPERLPATRAFEDLLGVAAREGGYAESLAVLVPVEWVYLTWARRAAERGGAPDRFYLAEWIDLHADPAFAALVGWLQDELDRVGAALSPRRRGRVADLFARAVELEVAFFDAAYG